MRIQTEKERIEKKNRIMYLIAGAAAFVYAELYMLHFLTLQNIDKRCTTSQALAMAGTHMTKHFFEIKVKPDDVMITLLLLSLAALAVVYLAMNQKLRKADNAESLNEARLMTLNDIKEFNIKRNSPYGEKTNDGPDNMILSKEIRLGMDGYRTRRNQNIIIIGASGAGKSRFFAAPNILQYNSNFVITDPSGELLRDYGKGLEDNGYRVKILNITDPRNSNHYNPFHYIKEEKDVFEIVDSLIKNTTPEGKSGGDPFFDDAANLLLSALMLLMWHTYEKKDQTIANLVQLLNLGIIDENSGSAQSPLDQKFEELRTRDENNLALTQYDSFKLGGAKTLKSVLITASTRLRIFSLSDIKQLMAYDDLHFETFNDSKQVLFVIIPTAKTTFNAVVSLMYNQLFTTLYRYGEQRVPLSWNLQAGNEHFKTFQASNKAQSKIAKIKAKNLLRKIKAGTVITYDEKKELYYISTKKDKIIIAWRGVKEEALKMQELLKQTEVVKGDPTGRAPNHTRFILDEFANISQLPDFEKLVATMRKYNISVDIIIQALSQLKAIYKDHWNDIIGNCDTKLVLGCEDTETLKWIIEVQGKKATRLENVSIGDGNKFSSSFNNSTSEVMTIDQLANMKEDECYVKVRGERPYYGKKYELTLHPNYKYAKSKQGVLSAGNAADGGIKPLLEREREKENINNELFSEDTDDGKIVTPRKKLESEKRAEAEAKKEISKEAASIRSGIDEMLSKSEMSEELIETFTKSLGLTTDSTPEEISEAAEATIKVQYVDSDESLKYTAT